MFSPHSPPLPTRPAFINILTEKENNKSPNAFMARIKQKCSQIKNTGHRKYNHKLRSPTFTHASLPLQYPDFANDTSKEKAIALLHYKGLNRCDLECHQGNQITIVSEIYKGWCFAYNNTTEAMGILPLNVLNQPIKPESPDCDYLSGEGHRKHLGNDNNVAPVPSCAASPMTYVQPGRNSVVPESPDCGYFSGEGQTKHLGNDNNAAPVPSYAASPMTNVQPERNSVAKTNSEDKKAYPYAIWFHVDAPYTATGTNDLSAQAGELLRWTDYSAEYFDDPKIPLPEMWLEVDNCYGEMGIFPSSFGHLMQSRLQTWSMLQQMPRAKAKQDLSDTLNTSFFLKARDIVFLSSKLDDSYLGYKFDGSIGIIPSNMIDVIYPL